MMSIVIGQDSDTDQIIEPDAENAEVVRMTIRIPKFLKDGMEKRAKAKGMMLLSRWVTALVQSNLTGDPVMTDAEIIALLASNRELAALGRNINQITKILNGNPYETEQVRLDKLADLSRAIANNRDAIFALVRASRQLWDVKE
jgi:hypothetical protein